MTAALTREMTQAVQVANLGKRVGDDDGEIARIPSEGHESDHRIVAADAIDGGIRLLCSCSWRSEVFPSGIGVAVAWEEHVRSTRPT
jgi:hypothetical protein